MLPRKTTAAAFGSHQGDPSTSMSHEMDSVDARPELRRPQLVAGGVQPIAPDEPAGRAKRL